MKTCKICGQPVGNEHPEAEVAHMSCAVKASPHLDDEQRAKALAQLKADQDYVAELERSWVRILLDD